MRKIISLTVADLKIWFRQPKLMIMSVAPLLIISIFAGLFLARTEILPVAIVMEDSDPAAIELKDYLTDLQSGSGALWFDAEEQDNAAAQEAFENGEVLGLITIPANLTERLDAGEEIGISIAINNINDDVTKNFLQRLQNAFNRFNDGLVADGVVCNIPSVDFIANVSPDLPLIQYFCASVLGLSILMSASLAITFSIAREFEDGTIRELVMTPRLGNILAGKFLSVVVQALIVTGFILLEEWIVFGCLPRDMAMQLPYFFWGVLFSVGLAALIAAKIKQVLPAGILVMVINIASWWISGGLAPSEAWTGLLRHIADFWPGTYFYQVYINASLLGGVSSRLMVKDLIITGIFAAAMLAAAHAVFVKEAKEL